MAEYLPSSSSSSSAAEKIAASSDLLTEILIRLPTRSLSKFKCVSKYWLSIITSHIFALLRNPDSTIVSGLFLQHYSINPFPEINFIPLINTIETPNPLPQLTDSALFLGPSNTVEIINSCHGLLLCSFSHIRNIGFNLEPNYFIINPTTKIFKILPKCYLADLTCLTLAFDPSKSPQYKVFGLRYTTSDSNGRGIMMYSSETGSWKDSGVPFTAKYKTQYDAGVYWNGAVNWFYSSRIPHSVYYNVDDERLGIVPLPPILEGGDWFNREYFRHYGESRGHLHLIELYDRMRRVLILEV